MSGSRALGWIFLGIAGLALLAGCGGSGPGAAGGGGGTAVSTLSASPTQYSRITTVTVQGNGLDQNIQLDGGEYCADVTRLGLGSEREVSFTCRLIRIGEHNFRVRDAGGRQLATLQFIVPPPQVTMNTSKGAIVVELDVPSAPEAVNIFLAQATGGSTAFFTNTIFHRLQAGVSIIGGLYQFTAGSAVLKANTRTPVRLESDNGLKNLRGTIALLPDPTGSLTARSRFLINLRDNPDNDRVSEAQPGAAVFGRVVSGIEFAEAIGNDPVIPVFFEPINVKETPVSISSISQSR